MKLALVYRDEIAKVFEVDNFHPASFMRGLTCQIREGKPQDMILYVQGAGFAGALVKTYHCDGGHDTIANCTWDIGAGSGPGRQAIIYTGR